MLLSIFLIVWGLLGIFAAPFLQRMAILMRPRPFMRRYDEWMRDHFYARPAYLWFVRGLGLCLVIAGALSSYTMLIS